MTELYYFHDPMCSWCWGFRPTAERLFTNLPKHVVRRNVLGGLAPDSDEPMPAAQRELIKRHWQRIESLLGTEFNYAFWTQCQPRRSTYPACRAVIAAANQGREEDMIRAIQEAYYLQARNPSDTSTHVEIAAEEGLDTALFQSDIGSAATESELRRQIGFCREGGVSGFPSLLLSHNDKLVPIAIDYSDHSDVLERIAEITAAAVDSVNVET